MKLLKFFLLACLLISTSVDAMKRKRNDSNDNNENQNQNQPRTKKQKLNSVKIYSFIDGNEDNTIDFPIDYFKHSKTIKDFFEDFPTPENNENIIIPIHASACSNEILEYVIDCLHIIHNSNNTEDDLKAKLVEDFSFLIDYQKIYNLMLTANYLDIQPLLQACAQRWGMFVFAAYNNNDPQYETPSRKIIELNTTLQLELRIICAQQSDVFRSVHDWICLNSIQLIRRLTGHNKRVKSITWHRDSTKFASCAGDTIKIWNPFNGECSSTIISPNEYVNSIAWSPDGTQLASCSDIDNTIKIWNPTNGLCSHTIPNIKNIYSITWNHHNFIAGYCRNDYAKEDYLHKPIVLNLEALLNFTKKFQTITIEQLYFLDQLTVIDLNTMQFDLRDETSMFRKIYNSLPNDIQKLIEWAVVL